MARDTDVRERAVSLAATTALKETARRGLVAGAIAGAVSTLWNVAAASVGPAAAWTTVKGASYPLFGPAALEPGFAAAPVVIGVVAHLGVALLWGTLFALAVERAPARFYLPLGAACGALAWAVMFFGVLPLYGAVELARAVPPGNAIVAHLLFGLGLGLAYRVLDSREEKERPGLAAALHDRV